METVQWYLRRLSVMSLAEIAHRATEPARLGVLKLESHLQRRNACTDWQRYAFCRATTAQLPQLPCAFSPSPEARERLLDGDWGALGFPWRWQAGAWHTAPDTGRAWPATFFGSIAYRTGNPLGDVRVLWEPARLQGLVSLALLTDQDPGCRTSATQLAERVLQSWVQDNPPLKGPHYISAMECALRLIAVCHALDMLRGESLHSATWAALASMLDSHATLISRRLSRHSSSGNHLIAECAGLCYAGVLFPEHPRAALWRATGVTLLQREAQRQVLADGGGIEQALHYHLFVVDLLGLVARLLASRGETDAPEIAAAAARGRTFLAALARGPEELPPIGDADSGAALTPHLRMSFPAISADRPEVTTFPESGYTRCEVRGKPPIDLLIDHGPLGMAPAFGHGHADALAVVLSVHGEALLIDPGTYGYNLGAAWRRYFRSTQAHNTVCVDGLDQAQQSGSFQWTQPYRARCVTQDGGDGDTVCRLVLRHDGYERVGIVHWRGVLVRRDGTLLIWDRLCGSGEHALELNWHLGLEPTSSSSTASGQCLTFGNGYCLTVSGGDVSLHRGEEHPLRGWNSPRYGVRLPVSQLRAAWSGRLVAHEFVTVIGPVQAKFDARAGIETLRSLQACRENA